MTTDSTHGTALLSEASRTERRERSRASFVFFWIVSLLTLWLVLRLVLFVAFAPDAVRWPQKFLAFGAGVHRDLYTALLLSLPLLLWTAFAHRRSSARWRGLLFWSACGLFWFATLFLLFVEYFFFEEFKSRFNTVAVDYLIYPHEVFVNIWESYPVGWFLAICGLLAGSWIFLAQRLYPGLRQRPSAAGNRWVPLLAAIALLALLTPTIRLKSPQISTDRTLNEIANNGAISFIAAAWTHHLDYAAFYKTLPREQAYQRARSLLSESNSTFTESGTTLTRQIAGDSGKPRLNVVIILEESLGSEFWGCLGRKEPTLTPEMDRLAREEGLLFTNLYASGNRTVRGMEGVLSSFPPLPGDSIVKRDKSDHVETIARVLQRDGYQTLFLYGGRGLFDSMRSFAVRNGYDRFIEQKHFVNPSFTTIWGVCDEDLFTRTIEECRDLARHGQPFFVTALTVSNHKPYTYPPGRIPEKPKGRDQAVKYADFALGEFFRMAKREPFWTNTIFAVVADHGARVYGKQSIPINSYEIPMVIAGPAVVKSPAHVGQLGCSLDVAPTILGLIGRPYHTLFFGRDLLRCNGGETRALLNHNRDIGLLVGERMAVLGLMKTEEFYQGNPKQGELRLLTEPSEIDRHLAADTIALFQVADELYTSQKYFLGEVR